MFVADGGTPTTIDELDARVAAASGIEGVSILGGEPFEQPAGVAAFARRVKQRGLTVMVYSGYTLAELRARPEPAVADLLGDIDLLVDGRYDRALPEPPPPVGRRWLGSTNQTMHYLTTAYTPDDPRMHGANTVELHWKDGRLLINGWPAGADALARIRHRR
jgi:anaerobic ribonucleoside-triphosphate reductase activating protein